MFSPEAPPWLDGRMERVSPLKVWILANTLMLSVISATTENLAQSQDQKCNTTVLQLEMDKCGERFKTDMEDVDPQNWCNLTHFIGEYHIFSACTENSAGKIGCFWPNPVVEHYITHIHKLFFSNCTVSSVVWDDPSEDTLTILILVPVFLTLAMVALVVWCSKQSDILA